VQKDWADLSKQNCWATQYFSNHDSQRQVSHYGSEKFRVPSAKLLAALLHTSPGTPYLYQGEEIGMVNVQFDTIEDYNCCYTVGDYNSMIFKGIDPETAIKTVGPCSRDNARTRYQWDASENAGFTTGKPWIKLNPKYTEINLEADRKAPDSIFAYYQKLIEMRKTHPAILDGDLNFYMEDSEQVIMYTRACARETMLVIANKSDENAAIELPAELANRIWKPILGNYPGETPAAGIELRPWECVIYTLY
jgi:oligo-1,6-glucosidase